MNINKAIEYLKEAERARKNAGVMSRRLQIAYKCSWSRNTIDNLTDGVTGNEARYIESLNKAKSILNQIRK